MYRGGHKGIQVLLYHKDILIGTKDGKILLINIDRANEFKEQEAKLMVSLPNERQINQLEYFTLNLEPSKYQNNRSSYDMYHCFNQLQCILLLWSE